MGNKYTIYFTMFLVLTVLVASYVLAAPFLTLMSPTNATTNTTSVNQTFIWSVNDTVDTNLTCRLYIDDVLNTTVYGNETVQTNVSDMIDSAHTWYVNCSDDSNVSNKTVARTLTIDTKAPTVTLTTPTNKSNISSVYLFNVTITDPVGITNVWFAISNATAIYQRNYTTTNTSTFYNASINTSNTSLFPVSGGTYNVTVFANDTNGNINSTIKYQFVVDNYAPIFNFTLSDRYVKSTDLVVITVNATDNISGISTVVAEGIALNQSANIWNGTILLGADEILNITVVDTANNTNTTSSASPGIYYAIDDDVPSFTITSPNTSQTIFTNANGNVTINFTLTEANATRWNFTIDGTVMSLTPSANNATNISIQNLSAGPHTIVFSAKDEAGNLATQVTRSITVVAQENVDTRMGTFTIVNKGKLNATLRNSTTALTGAQWMNQTLTLRFIANASVTDNYTVTMPSFNTSLANWNKTADLIVVTSKHSKQSNLSQNKSGTNITNLVLLQNVSNFVNDNYYNTSVIIFNQTLKDLNVLYIEDDQGYTIYNLTRCTGNTAPTSEVGTAAAACYTNDSANVTAYVPHLSGVALANDTVAPTVNLTAPVNTTTPQTNSFVQVTADVWEANPRATFCSYNISNATATIESGTFTTSNFSNTGVHYTHIHNYSGLLNGTYNYTLNCSDIGLRNSGAVKRNFSVLDATTPTVSAISTSSSGTGTATVTVSLTVTTNENANCAYHTTNVSYSSMSALAATGTTIHSNTFTYTTDTTGYYYIRCIDKNGNTMDFSNKTAFSADTTGSSSDSSGSGGGSGYTEPPKEDTIQNQQTFIISSDTSQTLTTTNLDIVDELKITFSNPVSDAKIKVVELKEGKEPSELSSTGSKTYQYFYVNRTNIENSDIDGVEFQFKVSLSWLSEQDIVKEKIVLKHNTDDGWEELKTDILSTDANYVYYTSETDSLSYFVVGVMSDQFFIIDVIRAFYENSEKFPEYTDPFKIIDLIRDFYENQG